MSWNLGMANFDWIKKNDLSMYQPSRQRANFLLHCRQNCFWETSADLPYTRIDRRNRFYIYEVILNKVFLCITYFFVLYKVEPWEVQGSPHHIPWQPIPSTVENNGCGYNLDNWTIGQLWLTSYLDLDSSLFKLCIKCFCSV